MQRIRRHAAWSAYLLSALALVWLAARREAATWRITVSRSDVHEARRAAEDLRGRPFTAREADRFAARWIEGRILLEEALRRGLDRQDPRIRATVLGAVYAAKAPQVREPTSAELRQYYARHRADYALPATVEVAVRAGGAPATSLTGMSHTDLRLVLGNEVADAVSRLGDGVWSETLETSAGPRTIRVEARQAARVQTYEEVRDLVRQDWFAAQQPMLVKPLLTDLRKRYRVAGLGR